MQSRKSHITLKRTGLFCHYVNGIFFALASPIHLYNTTCLHIQSQPKKKNLRSKLNVFSAGEKTNKLTPEKSNKASSEDILHFRTSVFLPASLRGDQQNHHFHYHDQVQSGKICGRRSCWLVVEVAKQKTKLLKYWLLGSRTAANAKAAWDFFVSSFNHDLLVIFVCLLQLSINQCFFFSVCVNRGAFSFLLMIILLSLLDCRNPCCCVVHHVMS